MLMEVVTQGGDELIENGQLRVAPTVGATGRKSTSNVELDGS